MALSMALTDTAIRNARRRDKPYKRTDGRGLYLLVQPGGSKLWHYQYSFGGKQKLMALGAYPDVPLVTARERHQEARKLLASGIDPMAQRKEEKTAEKTSTEGSFQTVAGLWWQHWRQGKSPRHADYVKRRLDADILPCLGASPVAEIEAPQVVAMMRALEERGVSDLAKRARETVGQIFRYAIAHAYTKRNPAAEIEPGDVLKTTRKVNFARVDATKELSELLLNIEVYRGTPVTRLAMKLLALTFVRTSELIEAPWKEFNLEALRWDIPAPRMKMKTPHIVPLSRQAVEVLCTLSHLTGDGEFLFPGDRANKTMSNNCILKALERMGYKGRMTGHGFRGLASTILHEHGFNHDHIELQLAHTPRNAVSAAYNHALYLEPRTKMLQWYADFLERTQHGAKIIPFVA
jgi:integrase